jgi:HEPN domain-containing protein
MDAQDPQEWLYRLSSAEWLAAARTELRHCEVALTRRAYRTGVTHARRAAGMALNAALVREPKLAWGRSYMDHLAAVAGDPDIDPGVRQAAATLLSTPPRSPELVKLGKPDTSSFQAAEIVIGWAAAKTTGTRDPSALSGVDKDN